MTDKLKRQREIRYTAIYNQYADKKLSNRAKYWSNERIERELAVKLPSRRIKQREYNDRQIKLRQERFKTLTQTKNYTLKTHGIEPDTTFIYSLIKKRKKQKEIYKEIDSKVDIETILFNTDVVDKPTNKHLQINEKTKRIKTWADWSKHKFPISILKIVTDINKRDGFNLDDSHGYIIVHSAYVNGKNPYEYQIKYFDKQREIYDVKTI